MNLRKISNTPSPAWSEIPYSHVFLPVEVSDGHAANMTLNLNQETGVVIDVDNADTHLLTLNGVTYTIPTETRGDANWAWLTVEVPTLF